MINSTSIDGVSKSLNSDDDIFPSSEGNFAISPQSLVFPAVVMSPFFPTELASSPDLHAATPAPSATFDVGPNNMTVTGAGGLSITLDFLTTDQTQAQENLVADAAQILANSIKISTALVPTGKVSLTDEIDFKGTGGGANSGPSPEYYYSYTTVRAALLANEPNDPNLAALPTTLPTNGNTDDKIVLSSAEAKVLGVTPPGALPADDSTSTFDDDIPSDALVGVALHELAHGLGRVPGGPSGADDAPDLFDLYRFTSAGNIYIDDAIPAQKAYFSVDGGKTTLAQYGTQSDPSDFLNGGTNTAGTSYANDPFNELYTPGQTVQGLTQLDLTQLDVLGFNTSGATPTPCYVTGTGIRTNLGDIPVERLRVGDRAVTASGQSRPIVWIGYRKVEISHYTDPAAVRPVRVLAGAFGQNLPRRDLWLSPGHSVVWEGVLIPISCLINGRSIAQIDKDSVEYWHIELDKHDILLAEGLPAESYLDCGNRTGFANGADFIEDHPEVRAKHWADTCLPLITDGPLVIAAKARLLADLAERGYGVDNNPDAHILADGHRINPIWASETRLAFAAPPGAAEITLKSKSFVPSHTCADSRDGRELGLCISSLQIDGYEVGLGNEACAQGWQPAEFSGGRFSHRWTRGHASLPSGARVVIVDLAGVGYYWRDPGNNVVTLSDWVGTRGRPRHCEAPSEPHAGWAAG